jgi:hypothetical protein
VSNPSEEFLSFEKALRELNLKSEELKKLVSEGEIRAFRDGAASMKFRREDVEVLRGKRGGEEELVFADALEDDATGMVTEDLSDEETLLAEEDVVEVTAAAKKRTAVAAAPRAGRTRIEAARQDEAPGWVTVVAGIATVLMLYGVMALYNITWDLGPTGLLSLFGR